MRLNLSVGGWELPLGRNAKGCLEAVKATAGEYPVEKAKKKGGLLLTQIHFSVCAYICQCGLMWAEAKMLENAAKPR